MNHTNRLIYLDYNASSPLKPAVRDAMLDVMDGPSNASAVHKFGRQARLHIENARRDLANSINCAADSIIFTSGAPEANNTVFMNYFDWPIISSVIEHPTVMAALPHDELQLLPVTHDGLIELDKLETALKYAENPALVSIIWVNNETGVIQPMTEISKLVKKYNGLLHTDASQAFGKIDIDFKGLDIDLMTLSSHKIGGPQGTGALVVKAGMDIEPLIVGGGQEKNRRAGTENVMAIVGFGAAAIKAVKDLENYKSLQKWRDAIETAVASHSPNTIFYGQNAPRVSNTTMFATPDLTADTQVINLDLDGIAVSNGSACSSGRVEPSRVLKAMGASDDLANCAIRISMGWNTSENDINTFIEVWKKIYDRVTS